MFIGKKSNISDTIHGTIFMTEFEKRIISTSLFNRLHGIYQNSTAYLTFPSNRTKRFEHSFGVMELCSQIFYYGISNANHKINPVTEINDFDKFFMLAKENVDEILSTIMSDGSKYNNKLGASFKKISAFRESYSEQLSEGLIEGGIYNILTPRNINDGNYFLYCVLLESVRIAALLHDVGHPPYSHIIEESMKYVFDELRGYEYEDLTKRQRDYINILKRFFGSSKANLHEEISVDIADKLLAESISDISADEAGDKNIYGNQIFEILVKEIVISIYKNKNSFFACLHSIIDGPLDGDRLDYVTRDTVNSGLETGGIEYKRILPTMKMIFAKDNDDFFFCPNIKNLNSIEDFYDKRWSLYKTIIYHHRVVKTDCLLKDCVIDIALDYLWEEAPTDETGDNSLPGNIAGLWLSLKKNPSDKEFSYSMVQWDDSWLMTVLKKHYFTHYIDEKSITKKKLDELLTNCKHYFSIVKTMDQFAVLDNSFAKEVSSHRNEIVAIINSKKPIPADKKVCIKNIENILNLSKEMTKNKMSNQISGFLLSEVNINLFLKGYMRTGLSFEKFIREQSKEIQKKYKDRIEDILLVFKKANTGTDNRLYFYTDVGEETRLKAFQDVSNSHSKLKIEVRLFPLFFIYILHKKEFKSKELYFNDFLKLFGTIIGEAFIKEIKLIIN